MLVRSKAVASSKKKLNPCCSYYTKIPNFSSVRDDLDNYRTYLQLNVF